MALFSVFALFLPACGSDSDDGNGDETECVGGTINNEGECVCPFNYELVDGKCHYSGSVTPSDYDSVTPGDPDLTDSDGIEDSDTEESVEEDPLREAVCPFDEIEACPLDNKMSTVLGECWCIDKYEATVIEPSEDAIDPCDGEAKGAAEDDYGENFPDDVTPADETATFMEACSFSAQIPSSFVTKAQAETACANVGKVLCPLEIHDMACWPGSSTESSYCPDAESPRDPTFPFGCDFAAYSQNCVNSDYATQKQESTEGACFGIGSIYNLSGNLAEWVADSDNPVGGSYEHSLAAQLSCGHENTAADGHEDYDSTKSYSNVGFRCCEQFTPKQ